MSQFVLDKVDGRENYSKVILQKHMTSPFAKIIDSPGSMADAIDDSVLPTPGLVQKRISEMSSLASSDKNSSERPFKRANNDKKQQFFGPKPFKSTFSSSSPATSLTVVSNSFHQVVNKETSVLQEKTPDVPPRSCSSEQIKPVLPPKPRNLSFTSLPHGSKLKENGVVHFDNESSQKYNESNASEDYSSKDENESKLSGRRFQSKSVCSYPVQQDTESSELQQRRKSCSEFQDLIQKKSEIRTRILSKITLLRDERDLLLEEKQDQDLQAQSILKSLEGQASASEVNRVYQYLLEVDQITKLTVGLNIRLNRINRMLEHKGVSDKEKETLHSKRQRLQDQLSETDYLHRNTTRRGDQVRSILSSHLSPDQLIEFDQYLMDLVEKITELKEMEQRVQLGEEQLVALNDSNVSIGSLADQSC